MRVPRATYRLQLHAGFTCAQAQAIVPYLFELGISDLYLSPILQCRPGSAHGYDVVDPLRIDDARGGEAGLRALAAEVRRFGMGIVLDIVPNHMAAAAENPYWSDVLAHGRASRYADWFEIRWHENGGRVVWPVRADPGPPEVGPHHEKVFWKDGTPRINYRRYLDLNDLVCLRMHDRGVFAATHAKVCELVREGLVTGLRIDHVDGLLDAGQYLHWLRAAVGEACWIVVESGETPPRDWPVQGTTGYDFLRIVSAGAVDAAGLQHLRRLYRRFVDRQPVDRDQVRDWVTRTLLAPEARAAGDDPARQRQFAVARDAKAIEDTVFYRDYPLLAFCELGCDPDMEALPAGEVRRLLARRPAETMSTTQTHDTKRGEDVRARLLALTGLAAEFETLVLAWHEQHAALRGDLDPNWEWFVYQTLIGAWPLADDRLEAYLVKAAREAKLETSWLAPCAAFEARLCAFARGVRDAVAPFAAKVAVRGADLSLRILEHKLTAPGVIDIYQGCELWDLALVDPDNRRPVDFAARNALLATLDQPIRDPLDPRRKLKCLRDGLAARERILAK